MVNKDKVAIYFINDGLFELDEYYTNYDQIYKSCLVHVNKEVKN